MTEMKSAWEAQPSGPVEFLEGTHMAYFFRESREKQQRLFKLCVNCLEGSFFVLYIAGKQGTKGIRLSMKDAGIDVAHFERNKKLKIFDSEEWFLNPGKNPSFRANESLMEQAMRTMTESRAGGNETLMVICETDQLVKKGFVRNYMEFEKIVSELADGRSIAFVCAYDERELAVSRVAKEEIVKLHSKTII